VQKREVGSEEVGVLRGDPRDKGVLGLSEVKELRCRCRDGVGAEEMLRGGAGDNGDPGLS
jgi:hypothetical protein